MDCGTTYKYVIKRLKIALKSVKNALFKGFFVIKCDFYQGLKKKALKRIITEKEGKRERENHPKLFL